MKSDKMIARVVVCFLLGQGAVLVPGQEKESAKITIPYQENWNKIIGVSRDAATVYFRGLCLYKSHISEIECRGGKEEVKQVIDFLASQKFESSYSEEEEPVGVGIGGWVQFSNAKGDPISTVFYMENNLCIDLDEEHRIIFMTAHQDEDTFYSDSEALPFVFFGKTAEKDGWKDLRVHRKMKEINEYRKAR
jgi:hypothetical protein